MNNTDKKCRNCFFGYPIDGGERAECHLNKPTLTRGHFPFVRGNDYCSFWTDEKTLERPFLIPVNGLTYYKVAAIEVADKRGE